MGPSEPTRPTPSEHEALRVREELAARVHLKSREDEARARKSQLMNLAIAVLFLLEEALRAYLRSRGAP